MRDKMRSAEYDRFILNIERSRQQPRCGRKRSYRSRKQARDAMLRLLARDVDSQCRKSAGRMSTYQCRYCGLWHFGHEQRTAKPVG